MACGLLRATNRQRRIPTSWNSLAKSFELEGVRFLGLGRVSLLLESFAGCFFHGCCSVAAETVDVAATTAAASQHVRRLFLQHRPEAACLATARVARKNFWSPFRVCAVSYSKHRGFACICTEHTCGLHSNTRWVHALATVHCRPDKTERALFSLLLSTRNN